MAGAKKVLSIIAFVVSGFCLMESLAGIVASYFAYVHGAVRGVPFHAYAQTTLIFVVATGTFFGAALRYGQSVSGGAAVWSSFRVAGDSTSVWKLGPAIISPRRK